MALTKLGKGLRSFLRRTPGRLLAGLLFLAIVATGYPRIEAHAHARGEPSHAPIIHLGVTPDHDHHHGHDHGPGEPHDGGASAGKLRNVVQHLHLLPHVVALPPALIQLPMPRLASQLPVAQFSIAPSIRPEELFRPPIR
jgi:hypothetical protein